MKLDSIETEAAPYGLTVLGAFHPRPEDDVPGPARTVSLIGPARGLFWSTFSTSNEYGDGRPNPLDRWSTRVIEAIAARLGGAALFPFGGPPYLPFMSWAQRTGRVWPSPVGLLVHDRDGLFVSFRGAVLLPDRLDLPRQGERPCDTCDGPCLTACPVGALGAEFYDVPTCKAYVAAPEGRACRERGCAVRRACPVGRDTRPDAQSAFHMAAFHGTDKK